jgi:hypothetical protein
MTSMSRMRGAKIRVPQATLTLGYGGGDGTECLFKTYPELSTAVENFTFPAAGVPSRWRSSN